MRKCVYCGHVFRGTPQRCPNCAELLLISASHLAGFSRLQLAISLSGLQGSETSLLEREALGYFKQGMSLANMAEAIEAQHNGRYPRFCTILRNLSAAG